MPHWERSKWSDEVSKINTELSDSERRISL